MKPLNEQLDSAIAVMRESGLTCDECLEQFKRMWMIRTLIAHRGNQCRAARELGMHRNTMRTMIHKLHIDIRALRRPKPELARKPAQSIGKFCSWQFTK